jgi:hypothetical protein
MEKIDVIGQNVYCYDLETTLIKSLNLNEFIGVDFSYLDGSKLFTININQPIKRVVKFTELNDIDFSAEFTEYLYDDMTLEQQEQFNSFVKQAIDL